MQRDAHQQIEVEGVSLFSAGGLTLYSDVLRACVTPSKESTKGQAQS